MNDNTLHPMHASLVACIMSRHALNIGRLIATEIMNWDFNEKADLPFPCLTQILCDHSTIPLSCYFDHQTIITKSINVALIKDVDNPFYKAKLACTIHPMTITLGPPPIVLSLEWKSIATPTDQPVGAATK